MKVYGRYNGEWVSREKLVEIGYTVDIDGYLIQCDQCKRVYKAVECPNCGAIDGKDC